MLRDFRLSRVLLALLLVLAFVFITLDYRAGRGSPLDGVRHGAARVFGPIQEGIAAGARPVGHVFAGVTAGTAAKARADRLATENTALRTQLAMTRAQVSKGPLEALLGLAGKDRFRIVAGRVVAIGTGLGFSWTATVDAGSRDGVVADLPVVDGDGLVGRVKATTASTATVLLTADPSSKVGVRVAGSGEVGVVSGQATGPLALQMLDANAVLRVGQTVSTFGSPRGRPYAAGIPVGRVSRILPGPGPGTRNALVTPFALSSALDVVGIVVAAPRVSRREAVLPPKPKPVVSAPTSRPTTSGRP